MIYGYYREKEGGNIPAGCDRLYKEREGSDYILNAVILNCGRGDKIVVNDIDEIGKSKRSMKMMLDYMRLKGVSMFCASTGEELTSDEWYIGNMDSEVQLKKREEVSEKIKEGIARAKEEGKQIGGEEKYRVEPEKEDMIMKAYELGMMKWESCAKELGGMSKSNFYLRYEKWKSNTKGEEEIGGESTND